MLTYFVATFIDWQMHLLYTVLSRKEGLGRGVISPRFPDEVVKDAFSRTGGDDGDDGENKTGAGGNANFQASSQKSIHVCVCGRSVERMLPDGVEYPVHLSGPSSMVSVVHLLHEVVQRLLCRAERFTVNTKNVSTGK